MLKRFTLLILLLIAIAAGGQAQSLLLKTKDGTTISKQLGSVKRITFSTNSLLVNYLSGPVETYSIGSISKLSFKMPPTGINPIELAASATMKIYPNPASETIYIQNAPETDYTASVYQMNGVLMFSTSKDSGSRSVDVSFLPAGFYILKINGQAFKFIKR
ncbi:MAG: T9SS type A sorting domain-containing protein [Prolixibacteraceae bacterium]|nr:T9SS type A sorting domain-containing protein [Prolixibacteraceae bacterium]